MCHMSYLCYLCAMKLEAFAHSVLSRLKGKPVFYGVGENQADTREIALGCLMWQWGGLGKLVSSNTWKLSSGWRFLQRGLYFICWHFCGERGSAVGDGGCHSFPVVIFASAFLTLRKASRSYTRPCSGHQWPNNPLLLGECSIFFFFFLSLERCPSGQQSLSLGCL